MSIFEVQAKTPLGKWMSIFCYGHSSRSANTCAAYRTPPAALVGVSQQNVRSATSKYETVGATRLGRFVDTYC